MASLADVRRIARSLPGTIDERGGLGFSVARSPGGKPKGYAWVWKERVDPTKPKVPNLKVFAVRVANNEEKALLLAADPDVFFTEPHYNGFPAVLVRLPSVDATQLRQILTSAHALFAPKPKREPVSVPRSPSRARSSPRGRARKR